MPVGVLLNNVTSREISEWAAYEKISGPLGDHYADDMLACIQEQLQYSNRFLAALVSTWGADPTKIPPPDRMRRPNEIFEDRPAPEDDPEYVDLETLMIYAENRD